MGKKNREWIILTLSLILFVLSIVFWGVSLSQSNAIRKENIELRYIKGQYERHYCPCCGTYLGE